MGEHSGAKNAELILNNFSPYILYRKFNRDNIEEKDIRFCNKRSQFIKNEGLYNLCKMFEKNLSELPTIMGTEEDDKQHCRYLTFWINDNIRKMFKTHHIPEYEQHLYMLAFLTVSNFVNNGLHKPHCNYYYNKGITMEIWKKWKDLYDYIRNKHNLEGIIISNKALCEMHSEYYSYIKDIYNNYKEECCQKQNGNCPYYLAFRDWCTEDIVFNKFSCPDSQQVDSPPVMSLEVVTEGERVGEEEEGKETKKGEHAQIQDLRGEALSVEKEGKLFLTETSVKEGLLDTEGTENLSKRQFDIEDNHDESSNHNASNPVRTITYTSLGLVLPLATLYRFTPLGSWVNTKILGRNKLMDNMKRNHYELLLNDVRNGEMSSNDTTYSISYNSASK